MAVSVSGSSLLKLTWGSLALSDRSLGGPGRPWGVHVQIRATLAVAVSATDRFVAYIACVINVFVISLRLQVSIGNYEARDLGPKRCCNVNSTRNGKLSADC